MELAQRSASPEGTVVITNNQYSGRGQRGNTWVTEPGQNLTFSVLLKPDLTPDKQFLLTQTISLAVADYIKAKTAGVKIKWPNDILVDKKKICGILIESSLSGSKVQFAVAGIGLNVNQIDFGTHQATSLKSVRDTTFDLNSELQLILKSIEVRYLQLNEGKQNLLKDEYLGMLYRRGEEHTFKTESGHIVGAIENVDEAGRLLVRTSAGIKVFNLKEISFVD